MAALRAGWQPRRSRLAAPAFAAPGLTSTCLLAARSPPHHISPVLPWLWPGLAVATPAAYSGYPNCTSYRLSNRPSTRTALATGG